MYCFRNHPRVILVMLIGVVMLTNSCYVYTFNPQGESDISSVAVERFENDTPEFGLADMMTNKVIDAFISDGTMNIVSVENADAVLIGKLVGYDRQPHEFTPDDEVISYVVTMDFDVVLKNSNDGSEIWKERISQQGIYQVDSETEEVGQQEAIKLLVETIINKTTKSW
ncbi:MAG: LptE family protein [candidate division Zixibacteria bacterium]|nr:LptE family protein [candidate division Zixibacteria bacterium]